MARYQEPGRTILVCFAILVLICTAGFFWLRYELSHMSFNFSNTDFGPAMTKLKAVAAVIFVMKRAPLATGGTSGHYRDLDIQADAKLFDAWQSAVELGNATFQHTKKGNWVRSSIAADYISPEKRLDPWNHPFCLFRRDDILLTLSAGPTATTSPVCRDIRVESSELTQLPAMRLIQSPAGNLILMMRAPSQRAQ